MKEQKDKKDKKDTSKKETKINLEKSKKKWKHIL